MKLSNGTMRPGKILQILENGEIKASAPGLFSEEDGPDALPPIYPYWCLFGGHPNSYSMPVMGEDIWVLNFSDNNRLLYWFRRDDFKKNNVSIKGEHVEVLCNRSIGDADNDIALLYFSDGTGWIMNNKETQLQFDKEGNINILTSPSGGGNINITNKGTTTINTDGNVILGTGANKPAARGPETVTALDLIHQALDAIANNFANESASKAAATPIIAQIKTSITAEKIQDKQTLIR